MAESPPNVRLNLAGTAENVVLVREMLSGIAEAIGLHGSDLNDIRTAVTEACNNVVLHAYGGTQGPLDVEVRIRQETLIVLVRDQGRGIQEKSDIDTSPTGIGLHVIQTLARTFKFTEAPGGGTDIRMEFAVSGIREPQPQPEESPAPATLALADQPRTTIVSIAPISLARAVLPRLVSALAARAHFSTDRISDAQILADALVAHAQGAVSGEHLSIGMSVEPRDLELRIAPLDVGRAQGLIGDSDVDGLGRVIEKLADRHDVVSAEHYETLMLGLIDRR